MNSGNIVWRQSKRRIYRSVYSAVLHAIVARKGAGDTFSNEASSFREVAQVPATTRIEELCPITMKQKQEPC